MIELNGSLKKLFIETAKKLKGSNRRQFMAQVVKDLGIGGQTLAEKELRWNRGTIRKGMKELISSQEIIDAHHRSGRKPIEEKLPFLLKDIKEIVEPHSQTDPSFKSTRLYTRISAATVRHQWGSASAYGTVAQQSITRTGATTTTAAPQLELIPSSWELSWPSH